MSDHDELMAKMREALDKKKPNDPGVEKHGHAQEKAPKGHGPAGGPQVHRRKAGGGGV